METLTEKNDEQSSVAELQEKIGIYLTIVFSVNTSYLDCLARRFFFSLHSDSVFPISL